MGLKHLPLPYRGSQAPRPGRISARAGPCEPGLRRGHRRRGRAAAPPDPCAPAAFGDKAPLAGRLGLPGHLQRSGVGGRRQGEGGRDSPF